MSSRDCCYVCKAYFFVKMSIRSSLTGDPDTDIFLLIIYFLFYLDSLVAIVSLTACTVLAADYGSGGF